MPLRPGLISIATIAITLASGASTMAQSPMPSFVEDGRLVVCTNPGTPPLTYLKSAGDLRPVGIDIDIADALGRLWAAEVTFTASEFSGLLTSLASGRCDMMIAGYYASAERTERNAYDMVPYLQTSAVIVTSSEDEHIRSPLDLSGKSVVIESGTTIYEDLVSAANKKIESKGMPSAKLSSYPTQTAATEQVLLGRADATISDAVETTMRVKMTGGRIKAAYTYPPSNEFAIYIVKNKENKMALKSALMELSAQGILSSIAQNYDLDDARFEPARRE